MGETKWPCEGPGCENRATAVFRTEFGDVYVCGEHWRAIATSKYKVSWLEELFCGEPCAPALTALKAPDGLGAVVHGTVESVLLTLKDAVRLGQSRVSFLSDAGLVGVDTAVEWDLEEVRRAER